MTECHFSAPDRRDTIATVGPPHPPKRLLQKRNSEWSNVDDYSDPSNDSDLRDSGISTASLMDFQSQLTNLSNLNNLSYEDFEPRMRCNDVLNISTNSVINTLSVSTGNIPTVPFQSLQLNADTEARIDKILHDRFSLYEPDY